MSNQMITFSFRIAPEAVQTLKKQAKKRNKSCGALLREMIEQISTKEERRQPPRPEGRSLKGGSTSSG